MLKSQFAPCGWRGRWSLVPPQPPAPPGTTTTGSAIPKSYKYSQWYSLLGAQEGICIIPWPPGWKPVLSGWSCCFQAVHSWVTHVGWHFRVFKAFLLFNLLISSLLMQRLSTAWVPCCWTLTARFSLSRVRWRWQITENAQVSEINWELLFFLSCRNLAHPPPPPKLSFITQFYSHFKG